VEQRRGMLAIDPLASPRSGNVIVRFPQ